MRKIKVKLGSNSYFIHIGSGLLAQIGTSLKEIGGSDKLVIITDTTVRNLYGNTCDLSGDIVLSNQVSSRGSCRRQTMKI